MGGTEEETMDYRTKFRMNEGCMILAYAYAVSGYIQAAIVFGIFSAFLAVICHSENCFFRNAPKIFAGTLIQIPFILVSSFPGFESTIVLLAFCNTVVSVLWMESSRKTLRSTMQIMTAVFPLFLLLTLIMPERALLFLAGSLMPRRSAVILILLIGLPLQVCYMLKRRKQCALSQTFGKFFTIIMKL